MTRRGRKRRLVLDGIGRKTSYRWRTEAGGMPPGRVAEEIRSSRYLSRLQRQRIATLRERRLGVREIARRIGRSPSTVWRAAPQPQAARQERL
jgi:IS30 family transposase